VLYKSLLGLGIIMVLANLKWKGQYSNLKQASVMFLIFSKQRSLENMCKGTSRVALNQY